MSREAQRQQASLQSLSSGAERVVGAVDEALQRKLAAAIAQTAAAEAAAEQQRQETCVARLAPGCRALRWCERALTPSRRRYSSHRPRRDSHRHRPRREAKLKAVAVRKEDVEAVAAAFDISKGAAEHQLRLRGGDAAATMRALIGY